LFAGEQRREREFLEELNSEKEKKTKEAEETKENGTRVSCVT